MTASPRRLARELVLQALYACEHGEDSCDAAFEKLVSDHKLNQRNLDYARTLLRLIQENKDWADDQIRLLAENWALERIAAVDRTILRMGLVELEKMPDIPVKVALNESIELAKKFSTRESSKFINGILDNFVGRMENT